MPCIIQHIFSLGIHNVSRNKIAHSFYMRDIRYLCYTTIENKTFLFYMISHTIERIFIQSLVSKSIE